MKDKNHMHTWGDGENQENKINISVFLPQIKIKISVLMLKIFINLIK